MPIRNIVKSKLKVVTDDLANNPKYDKMRVMFASEKYKKTDKVIKIVGFGIIIASIVLECIL